MLRPCQNSAAFELVPEEQVALDLGAAREALAAAGYEVVLDAGVMLLVRRHLEITLHRSGRILLKTRDGTEAQEAYTALAPLLDEARKR